MPTLLDAARRVVETSLPTDADNAKALNDLEAALSEYGWSDEPPSEPGWYWCRHPTDPDLVWIFKVWKTDDDLLIMRNGEVESVTESPEAQWAGPIPEPPCTHEWAMQESGGQTEYVCTKCNQRRNA